MSGGTIARADMRGKILEIKDLLTMAYAEDYAALQGQGGKKHAPKSVIQLCLTDYSDSQNTNGKAIFVKANVEYPEFSKWKEIALANLGSWRIADSILSAGAMAAFNCDAMLRRQIEWQSDLSKVIATYFKLDNTKSGADSFPTSYAADSFGQLGEIQCADVGGNAGINELPIFRDYEFRTEKVNPYATWINGDREYANVSTLQVLRQQFAVKNGVAELRKLPWSIRISNFAAALNRKQAGTVTFDSKTAADVKTAVISLSDDIVFNLCVRVEHFVSAWEQAVCSEMIRNAVFGAAQNNQPVEPYENAAGPMEPGYGPEYWGQP